MHQIEYDKLLTKIGFKEIAFYRIKIGLIFMVYLDFIKKLIIIKFLLKIGKNVYW